MHPRLPGCVASTLLVLSLCACGSEPTLTAQPVAPILLIGVDGLEWSVLQPLLAEGRCPNLLALMERGVYGRLGTFKPTLSPIIWTTIATGTMPAQHGILHMLDPQQRAYTSARREGRALWNIADRYGLTSNVFGWWITWPVEPVRGVMVSGTNAAAQVEQNWKPALVPGIPDQVHPPELTDEVLALAERAGSRERVLALARERVFGAIPDGVLGEAETQLVNQTLWSIQSDATFFEIARTLLPTHPADLSLVYLGGTDVAGHRFWRHYEPEAFAWSGSSPQADAALADVIPDYYAWTDEMIGELVDAVGPDTIVMVVSDHGMHAVSTQAPNEDDITGHHDDGAPGVLVAAGPGIATQGKVERFLQNGALPTLGSVRDVAPTVLALLGVPASRAMASRPYKWMFTPEIQQRVDALGFVDTHDDGFRPAHVVPIPEAVEAEFTKRMEQLGYLELEVPPEGRVEFVNPEDFVPDAEQPSQR